MKRILFLSLFILSTIYTWGQTQLKGVVFDITSKDTTVHKTVLRHAIGEAKSHPEMQFEVVIWGGSIQMAMKEKSIVADRIKEAQAYSNLKFNVCEGTMKRVNVDKSQLLPGVGTVPDGIIEIAEKQVQGWGYVKEVQY